MLTSLLPAYLPACLLFMPLTKNFLVSGAFCFIAKENLCQGQKLPLGSHCADKKILCQALILLTFAPDFQFFQVTDKKILCQRHSGSTAPDHFF